MSFDTNVISDVIYYYILEGKGKPHKKELKRLSDSMESIILALSVNARLLGIDMVRRELKRRPLLGDIYDAIFEESVKVNKDVKWLAKSYTDRLKIKNADALIVASASIGKIDLFLSWNRDDIVNHANLKEIRSANRKRSVPFPIFATPEEFLDRVFLTQNQTIGLSQTPSPRQFHPKTF
jgi:hypothetical protein